MTKLCECGCGQPTNPAPKTSARNGWVQGVPMRYCKGHAGTLPQTYVVEDHGYETPCWIWQGRLADGYPMLRDKRRAHAVAFTESGGIIPRNGHVHHRCETRACVRPDHLVGLTRRDHRCVHVGKLSDDDARTIYASTETHREVAARFGISYHYARHIRNGSRLAHVTGAKSGQ